MSSEFNHSDAPLPQSDVISESQTLISRLEFSRFDHSSTGLAATIAPWPPFDPDHRAALLCQISEAKVSAISIHASPLMPLRTRDWQALTDLFQQNEIEVIEADIVENLLKRSPVPAWEDLDSHLLHNFL